MGKLWNFILGVPSDLENRTETPVYTEPSYSAITPPPRTSSTRVTADEAMGLSSVYRAISVLSTATKQLSFTTYKDDEKVNPPSFIKRPNIDSSRSAFIEETVVSMATNGNAYWLIDRDAQGRVTNLTVLNPLDVEIDTDSRNRVKAYLWQGKTLKPSEIHQLKLLRVPGKAKGLGPIQSAQVELGGTRDVRDYANNWFHDSGTPTGVLKSDQMLSPEQAQQAKKSFIENASGGVAVLGNGLDYSQVYLSPEDAQWIESQQFNVTAIARLFGIPASLLLAAVDGSSLTYSNLEQDSIWFIRYTVSQYLVEIEDSLSSLLPGRTEVKFNVEALLRTDSKTRAEVHNLALQGKWRTVDEVREIENLPPLPNIPAPTPEEDSL